MTINVNEFRAITTTLLQLNNVYGTERYTIQQEGDLFTLLAPVGAYPPTDAKETIALLRRLRIAAEGRSR